MQQQVSTLLAEYATRTVTAITYSDRYLASPQAVILLGQLLKAMPFTVDPACMIYVHMLASQPVKEQYLSRRLSANWYPQEKEARVAFTE